MRTYKYGNISLTFREGDTMLLHKIHKCTDELIKQGKATNTTSAIRYILDNSIDKNGKLK